MKKGKNKNEIILFQYLWKGNALIDYNSGCVLQEFRNEHRREIT